MIKSPTAICGSECHSVEPNGWKLDSNLLPQLLKHLGSLLFYNSISLSDDDGQHPFHLPLGLLERDVQVLVVLDHHLGESADHFYVEKMASLSMDYYHSIV